MLKKEKELFRNLLVKEIDSLLERLESESTLLIHLPDGENTVCLVCDEPVKPCKQIPGYRCNDALKGSTEVDELEKALIRLKNNTFGICQKCFHPISVTFLKKNLTAEICKKCS